MSPVNVEKHAALMRFKNANLRRKALGLPLLKNPNRAVHLQCKCGTCRLCVAKRRGHLKRIKCHCGTCKLCRHRESNRRSRKRKEYLKVRWISQLNLGGI